MMTFAGKCNLCEVPEGDAAKICSPFFVLVDWYRLIEKDHFALCLAVSRMAL